jgi:hypothetical protein
MPYYLSVEKAIAKLIDNGIYPPEEVPPTEYLEETLGLLEGAINSWFGGYTIAIAQYTEERIAKRNCRIVLPIYPVKEILKVQKIIPGFIGQKADQYVDAVAIRVGENTIEVTEPFFRYFITYTSGWEPLPDGLDDVVYQLLVKALTQGDISFLDEQARYVTSTTLPKISQTFIIPGAAALTSRTLSLKGGGFTELDKMLGRYSKFKRTIAY